MKIKSAETGNNYSIIKGKGSLSQPFLISASWIWPTPFTRRPCVLNGSQPASFIHCCSHDKSWKSVHIITTEWKKLVYECTRSLFPASVYITYIHSHTHNYTGTCTFNSNSKIWLIKLPRPDQHYHVLGEVLPSQQLEKTHNS